MPPRSPRSTKFSARRAAEYTGYSERWIRQLCDSGQIPHTRTEKGQYLIDQVVLEPYRQQKLREHDDQEGGAEIIPALSPDPGQQMALFVASNVNQLYELVRDQQRQLMVLAAENAELQLQLEQSAARERALPAATSWWRRAFSRWRLALR